MNGQVTPIPELCTHYIREIKKAQRDSLPVDSRQWIKTLKKRGVPIHLLGETSTPDELIERLSVIKKEYEIHG